MPISIGISLTGGEPFYSKGLLMAAVKFSQSLSLEATVITSAFWGKSYNLCY